MKSMLFVTIILLAGCTTGSGYHDVYRKEIRAEVESLMPAMKLCRNELIKRDPQFQGPKTVIMNWEIELDGRAKNVKVYKTEFSSKNEHIHQCIAEAIKQAQFPAIAGEKPIIRFPFVFQGEDEKGSL